MFLKTIDEMSADGRIAEIYQGQKSRLGFVMSAVKCFTSRPDLLPTYVEFAEGIRAKFSLGLRDWRLITLIAAKEARSNYCSYVYGQQLIDDLGSKKAVIAVQRNFRTAGLSERDVAMLAYAEKVASNSPEITQADIDQLRAAGFEDEEICDIALCAAFRCFVGRFFDATGAEPETAFIDADEEFRAAMTVGRSL